ncbi:unnamed protein product, partial [Prorocentrum cordatum]
MSCRAPKDAALSLCVDVLACKGAPPGDRLNHEGKDATTLLNLRAAKRVDGKSLHKQVFCALVPAESCFADALDRRTHSLSAEQKEHRKTNRLRQVLVAKTVDEVNLEQPWTKRACVHRTVRYGGLLEKDTVALLTLAVPECGALKEGGCLPGPDGVLDEEFIQTAAEHKALKTRLPTLQRMYKWNGEQATSPTAKEFRRRLAARVDLRRPKAQGDLRLQFRPCEMSKIAGIVRRSAGWARRAPSAPAKELSREFIPGPKCFMKDAAKVAELLPTDWRKERWPLIPAEELDASSADLPRPARDGETLVTANVFMHQRRASLGARAGSGRACVRNRCKDCRKGQKPRLAPHALSNFPGLGRRPPEFWGASIGRQLLLALGRVAPTKAHLSGSGVGEAARQRATTQTREFLQEGMPGRTIAFPHGSIDDAVNSFPPGENVFQHTFAAVFHRGAGRPAAASYACADENVKYRADLRGALPAERAVPSCALARARLAQVDPGDAGETRAQGPATSMAAGSQEKEAAEGVDAAARVKNLSVLEDDAADAAELC